MFQTLRSINLVSIRRYAIIKNTVVQHKPYPQFKSFEQYPPNEGNFDKPDPLSEIPDWTYVDPKRLSPLSEIQLAKQRHQCMLAQKVVQYLKEIKDAESDVEEAKKLESKKREIDLKRRPKAKGTVSMNG